MSLLPFPIMQDVLPEQLLELAKKSGADAAEVFQSKSLSRPVFFEANRLKQLESAEAEGVALRLWYRGRPGLAVAYGPVEAQPLVDKAIALSDLNEAETIELNTPYACRYDDVGENVSVETLIDWGKQAIEFVRQECPEAICTAEWDCEIESTRLVNSLGLDCSHSDTTLSCFLSAELVRGEDFLSVGDGQTERGSLSPALLAKKIIQRLDWAKENVSPPIGKLPVLFTTKSAEILWGTISAALNGKMVIEKASPWSERMGELVTSNQVTLYQHPDKGPYSCPFDDEGTNTRSLTFIDKGILQLFYTDRTIGKLLSSGSTGNGFRPSLGSYPTPGLFNLLVMPGSGNIADLVVDIKDGVLVDQTLGGGAGISGDFSVNVDLGYYIKNGEIIGRVKDTMIAGNVYTALKQLLQLGGDAEWSGSCYTPSILVDGLSITGRS